MHQFCTIESILNLDLKVQACAFKTVHPETIAVSLTQSFTVASLVFGVMLKFAHFSLVRKSLLLFERRSLTKDHVFLFRRDLSTAYHS